MKKQTKQETVVETVKEQPFVSSGNPLADQAARMQNWTTIQRAIQATPEEALRRVQSGSPLPGDKEIVERSIEQGRTFGTTPADFAREQTDKQALRERDPAWIDEVKRKEQQADADAREAENDRKFSLLLIRLDSATAKFRSYGISICAEAEGLRNRTRQNFIRDMRFDRERFGISGAASTLARYERETIPATIRKIEALQTKFMADVAAERQKQMKLKLEAEARRIAPDEALAALERAGAHLRLGDDGSIEVAGTLDERGEAIVARHYEAVVDSLKQRQNFRPIARTA
jgi:hypothetical protein